MRDILNTAVEVNQMLGLVFNDSRSKFLVDNRKELIKIILNDKVSEEVETYPYLGVLLKNNDLKLVANLDYRLQKAAKVSGAVLGVMKGGYNSYDIGRLLFSAQIRPSFEYASEALPYYLNYFKRWKRCGLSLGKVCSNVSIARQMLC